MASGDGKKKRNVTRFETDFTDPSRENFSKYFSEFCNNTTIHGLKYLGELERSKAEKIWWTVMFVISVILCVFLMLVAYWKWEQSPFLVTTVQNPSPLTEIPFPAVTLCPPQTVFTDLYDFSAYFEAKKTQIGHRDTSQQFSAFSFTPRMEMDIAGRSFGHDSRWVPKIVHNETTDTCHVTCEYEPSSVAAELGNAVRKRHVDQDTFEANKYENDTELLDNVYLYCNGRVWSKMLEDNDFMSLISANVNKVIRSYNVSSNRTYNDLFTYTLTEKGICFTMNLLNGSDFYTEKMARYANLTSHGNPSDGWTPEGGYPAGAPPEAFPLRAVNRLRLYLKITDAKYDWFRCSKLSNFLVYFHHPAETVNVNEHEPVTLQADNQIFLTVTPEMTIASAEYRALPVAVRGCYFQGERRLYFYKHYTRSNCEMECLANATLFALGNVASFMPHETDTPTKENEEHVGKTEDFQNVFWAYNGDIEELKKDDIYVRYKYAMAKAGITSFKNDSDLEKCSCLPTCVTLKYKVKQKDIRQLEVNEEERGYSFVYIVFGKRSFHKFEMKKIFEPIDFVSNCGGLMGLFTGFSFLSIFEIVYYLTLRIWCNVKRHGRVYWIPSPSTD